MLRESVSGTTRVAGVPVRVQRNRNKKRRREEKDDEDVGMFLPFEPEGDDGSEWPMNRLGFNSTKAGASHMQSLSLFCRTRQSHRI
jgi:hypothetical protein